MIYTCKNGLSLYYNIESLSSLVYQDFFVSDVHSILEHTNPDIKSIYYIVGIPNIYSMDISEVKDVYTSMLKEFISDHHNDEFIIIRMGSYFGAQKTQECQEKENEFFVEKYVAIHNAGFVNVNSYTDLEYSQTFVYHNNISSKFIEAIRRYEALECLKGSDFNFEKDILKKIK